MTWPFGHLRMFGYGVVAIDPPWPWEAYGENGYDKSPEAQYRTMTLAEIAALPVGQLVGAGGAVIVWCTWPLIATQTRIIEGDWPNAATGRREGWGLKVRTGGSWAKRTPSGKLRWGPGYIMRSVCEPFLICSPGQPDHLRGRDQHNMVETIVEAFDCESFDGLARRHSQKPDEWYKKIEAITSPTVFRADVFGRMQREGWDVFGDEAYKFSGGGGDHQPHEGQLPRARHRGGVVRSRDQDHGVVAPHFLLEPADQPRDEAGAPGASDGAGVRGKASGARKRRSRDGR